MQLLFGEDEQADGVVPQEAPGPHWDSLGRCPGGEAQEMSLMDTGKSISAENGQLSRKRIGWVSFSYISNHPTFLLTVNRRVSPWGTSWSSQLTSWPANTSVGQSALLLWKTLKNKLNKSHIALF